ncbi:MAG: 4Fe-4S dicluster domain-containing protein [Planctomycetes bacterium]|nr:4Fe-4S dicluster domain-containing protein [Planctomycetota bacterium]
MSHDVFKADSKLPDRLLVALREQGYTTIGPTARDGAIVLDEIHASADLPVGLREDQEAGHYRLQARRDEAVFGHTVGPQSWKRYLFPPNHRLWAAKRSGGSFEIKPQHEADHRLAFIGVRPCELAALEIQDRVFFGEEHVDPHYAALRTRAFIVTVNCAEAAPTCFCGSMGTGPRAEDGYDLALTEILGRGRHEFLVEVGSERGATLLEALELKPAGKDALEAARKKAAELAGSMTRRVETDGLAEALMANLEHPHWAKTAERCLACANCTMVCPTCFCSTVEDVADLSGDHDERWRRWDSCFNSQHSYVHGGNMRPTIRSRYRQWLTHKFAGWIDQFGTSGCVGCGRCITWCPAAIDLTEELAALRGAVTT